MQFQRTTDWKLKKDEKIFGPYHRTENAVVHERDGDTSCRQNRQHSDYAIVEIVLNTLKNPGNLRRLSITQNLEKAHQRTLMWKTCKESKLMHLEQCRTAWLKGWKSWKSDESSERSSVNIRVKNSHEV